jgi:hypothetical protein
MRCGDGGFRWNAASFTPLTNCAFPVGSSSSVGIAIIIDIAE